MRHSWMLSGTATPTPGVVLVVAGALELERRVVEEETAVRVEAHGPVAEPDFGRVDHGAGGQELGAQEVESRRLEAPERGFVDRDGLLDVAVP